MKIYRVSTVFGEMVDNYFSKKENALKFAQECIDASKLEGFKLFSADSSVGGFSARMMRGASILTVSCEEVSVCA